MPVGGVKTAIAANKTKKAENIEKVAKASRRGKASEQVGVKRISGKKGGTMFPGNDLFTMPGYTGPMRRVRTNRNAVSTSVSATGRSMTTSGGGGSKPPASSSTRSMRARGETLPANTKPGLEVLSVERNRKSNRAKYMAAGGLAAGAAALYSAQGEKESTPSNPKGADPVWNPPLKMKTTPAPSKASEPSASSAGTSVPAPSSNKAPAASTKPKSTPRAAGKTMKGQELADFLGLGADSAVRHYMTTGKHKYPSGNQGATKKRPYKRG